jgi:hypothetical protein
MKTAKNNLYKENFISYNMEKKRGTASYIYFNCLNPNRYSNIYITLNTYRVLFNLSETLNLNKS